MGGPSKVIINLKKGSKECDGMCEELYARLKELRIEVLYDDTDARAGAKFANMDLIGLPFQVIIGPKSAKKKMVEVKIRATGARFECDLPDALTKVVE